MIRGGMASGKRKGSPTPRSRSVSGSESIISTGARPKTAVVQRKLVKTNSKTQITAEQTPSSSSAAVKPKVDAKQQYGQNSVDQEMEKWQLHTLILTYLTAQLESRNAKLRALAEEGLQFQLKQFDMCSELVCENERKHDLAEKEKEVDEVLDLQVATLTPVATIAPQFTNYYSYFTKNLACMEHLLSVYNYYIGGNEIEFLDKAENSLKESEDILVEFEEVDNKQNAASLELVRCMKTTSKVVSQQLASSFEMLLKLCSLACHYSVNVQQAKEEEQLGDSRIRELFSTVMLSKV
ncbi:uncharacterized protein LOC115408034 [Salarias fasciatus]|uniref:uncharacterized protein LOC115408034 n=1 Tax=Salarias fasciatus TaxID=181472 RepID=UPI0011767FFF|nr:uncharacterized protein LOC115408034 [Salarias fasciatus]